MRHSQEMRAPKKAHRGPVITKPRFAALVWDDDKRMCKSLASLLRNCGLHVIAHEKQEELWKRAQKSRFPIVTAFFDWIDQGNDDYEAGLRAVQYVAEKYAHCYINVFSGHADQLVNHKGPGYERAAYDAGAHTVLLKGQLGALDSVSDLACEVWTGIGFKQGTAILHEDPSLDLKSVVVTWLKSNEPSGGKFQMDDARFDQLKELESKSDAEQAMDRIYDQLRDLVDTKGRITNEGKYVQLLSELKEIERNEALRLRALFEEHRPLKEDVARAFLKETEPKSR